MPVVPTLLRNWSCPARVVYVLTDMTRLHFHVHCPQVDTRQQMNRTAVPDPEQKNPMPRQNLPPPPLPITQQSTPFPGTRSPKIAKNAQQNKYFKDMYTTEPQFVKTTHQNTTDRKCANPGHTTNRPAHPEPGTPYIYPLPQHSRAPTISRTPTHPRTLTQASTTLPCPCVQPPHDHLPATTPRPARVAELGHMHLGQNPRPGSGERRRGVGKSAPFAPPVSLATDLISLLSLIRERNYVHHSAS